MSSNHDVTELKLRPHHAFCAQFLLYDTTELGAAFKEIEAKIIFILRSAPDTSPDTFIELVEGIDDACCKCVFGQSGRCEYPKGNEDETRKWDVIVLRELGLSYGDRMTVKDFTALVEEKAPLVFCETKCPYRFTCEVVEKTKRLPESPACN